MAFKFLGQGMAARHGWQFNDQLVMSFTVKRLLPL